MVWFWPTQLVALGIAKTHSSKLSRVNKNTCHYPSSQKQTITLWGCFLAVGLRWLVAKDRYWLQETQGFLNWELKERYHASNEPNFEIAQGTWFPQCHNHSTQWLQNWKLEHQTRECTRKLEHSTFTYGSKSLWDLRRIDCKIALWTALEVSSNNRKINELNLKCSQAGTRWSHCLIYSTSATIWPRCEARHPATKKTWYPWLCFDECKRSRCWSAKYREIYYKWLPADTPPNSILHLSWWWCRMLVSQLFLFFNGARGHQ